MKTDKVLLTKRTKEYVIPFTAFTKNIETDFDENLMSPKCPTLSYNYINSKGKLQNGNGFRHLHLWSRNGQDKQINFGYLTRLDGVFHYRNYVDSVATRIDELLMYDKEEKNIYWAEVWSNEPNVYPVFNSCFTSKPNAINYRLNGIDSVIFSSPTDSMRVHHFRDNVRVVNNGPKLVSTCLHYERLFAILEGEGIRLVFSANLDPTNWNEEIDEAGFIDFVDERGKLLKVVSFNDYVYVFREFGISRVSAYGSQEDFAVSHIYKSSVPIYGQSVAICGDKIMFLAQDGIYTFDGYNISRAELGFEKLIASPNSAAIGVFHNGKYYLACKLNYGDNLTIGSEAIQFNANNSFIEVDPKTWGVTISRGMDISSMISLQYEQYTKLVVSFKVGHTNALGELTTDGKFFGTSLPKYWSSPMSNLGYPNKIKRVKAIILLAKNDCDVEITTDKESMTYHIEGKDTTQRIRTNVVGELVKVTFKSSGDADISYPELVVQM